MMARIEAKLEFDMSGPRRLLGRLKALARPQRGVDPKDGKGSASAYIAPRDAGWAELMTADGLTRMGRGHLLIWPTDSTRPALGEAAQETSGPAKVEKDAGLAVGGDAPHLRGELRSFTVDAGPPVRGDSLVVRPENESGMYPVVVQSYDSTRGQHVVQLDWPDEHLPAALRELGGD